MRQLATYAFANAKVRALLSFLIGPAGFDALIEEKDAYAVLEALKGTAYKGVVEKINTKTLNLVLAEKAFLKNDISLYRKVQLALGSKKGRQFVSLIMERYEIEQLKLILRLWHTKTLAAVDDYLLDETIVYPIDFKKILASQTIEEIIILLDHTPYKQSLLRARDKFKSSNSLFYLEAALDVDFYLRLIAAVEHFSSTDKTVAMRILGVEIDIENIRWLIKLRKYYSLGLGEMLEWIIPGGLRISKDTVRRFYTTDGLTKVVEGLAFGPYLPIKEMAEGDITLIEGFLYEILLKEVKKALSGFPFTIGTILGYLILKHRETRGIISLLYAKSYGLSKDEIAPLLPA